MKRSGHELLKTEKPKNGTLRFIIKRVK
ncbi:MAG: hypothetical protein ACK4SY_08550 [Pyrobaculum sp.]